MATCKKERNQQIVTVSGREVWPKGREGKGRGEGVRRRAVV